MYFIAIAMLTAQKSRPFFNNEIGLDLLHWVQGKPGITVVVKHVPGKPIDLPWQNSSAIRLLGGYYQKEISIDRLPLFEGDTVTQFFANDPMKRDYFGYGGWEYQLTVERWRLYFGTDLGYRFSAYTADIRSQAALQSTGELVGTDVYKNKVLTHSVQLGVLTGVQFFFSKRCSISAEMNMEGGLDFTTSNTIRGGAWKPLQTIKRLSYWTCGSGGCCM